MTTSYSLPSFVRQSFGTNTHFPPLFQDWHIIYQNEGGFYAFFSHFRREISILFTTFHFEIQNTSEKRKKTLAGKRLSRKLVSATISLVHYVQEISLFQLQSGETIKLSKPAITSCHFYSECIFNLWLKPASNKEHTREMRKKRKEIKRIDI